MAKKPTDPSSKSTTPAGTGETVAGEEKRHEVMEAETGHYNIDGSAVEFVQVSAQAAKILGEASSTATETGHEDFAKAAQAAVVQINNNIFVLGDGNTVNPQLSFDIDQDISAKQQSAERMEKELAAAGVDFSDCVRQRQERLEQAKRTWSLDTGKAWTLYLECLGLKSLSAYLSK